MDRGAQWATVHRVTKSWTCVKLLSMHRAIKTRAQVHWGSAVALGVKPESVLCLPFQFPFRRIFLASEHSLLPFHNSSAFKQMFKKCPLCFSLSARKFFQIISLKIGISLALCLKQESVEIEQVLGSYSSLFGAQFHQLL